MVELGGFPSRRDFDSRNFKCIITVSVQRLISFLSSNQIPITLHKDKDYDEEGREVLKCGFKIGGGIDQDFKKSPQGYTDNVSSHHSPEPVSNNNSRPSPFQGIYVTEVHESSASAKAGLRIHDKILQCNGYDFTMVRSLSSDILKYNISFLCR